MFFKNKCCFSWICAMNSLGNFDEACSSSCILSLHAGDEVFLGYSGCWLFTDLNTNTRWQVQVHVLIHSKLTSCNSNKQYTSNHICTLINSIRTYKDRQSQKLQASRHITCRVCSLLPITHCCCRSCATCVLLGPACNMLTAPLGIWFLICSI